MIQDLILWLNERTEEYERGEPTVSDAEWDSKYFQLLEFEKEYGYAYPNSPTQKIIYENVNELEKIQHEHLMLSLPKTKDEDEALNTIEDPCIMLKMDGLTISLTYENGRLTRAETRGDGEIGENVLHNAKIIPSIPNTINTNMKKLVIDGEIICNYKNFQPFSNDYKNPRNFAAGSIRLLDSRECSKRQLEFVAWDVIEGFDGKDSLEDKLKSIKKLGFTIVPFMQDSYKKYADNTVEAMKVVAAQLAYPIDGLVYKEKSAKKRAKMESTSHHLGGAIALKFLDEEFETYLKNIDWTMGRLGFLTPVALFEPIDDGDSVIERASLHNISVMEELLEKPYLGQPIRVIKANQIIPQVVWGEKGDYGQKICLTIPNKCPVCGSPVQIVESVSGVKNLYCTNDFCSGKIINQIDHFAGKKGLDIKGLSIATISKLVDWGWLSSISDLFKLNPFLKEWSLKPGYGKRSVEKILTAINQARETSLDKFITALGIPLIGSAVSKEICKHFETYTDFREAIDSNYDFSEWSGFGEEMSNSLLTYDYSVADEIYDNYLMVANKHFTKGKTNKKLDITVVITGKLNNFKNRDELKEQIELAGGKVASSVSNKTDYLINNNIDSNSSKNLKAKSLNIPIITEEEFCSKFL